MGTLAFLSLLLAPGCGLTEVPAPPDDTGSSSTQYGDLGVSHTELDFGYVEAGTSAQKTLTFSNTGAYPIAIQSLVVDNLAFTVLEQATLATSIGAGEDLVLTVEFAPDAEVDFTGELTLSTDASGAEQVNVALSGTANESSGGDTGDTGGGGGAAVSINRTTVDFGEVEISGNPVGEPVIVQNTGSEDLLITHVTGSASEWGWDGDFALPYVLAAGASKEFDLTFDPSAEGSASGTVTIRTNADTDPNVVVDVSGVGIDSCDICSPLIDLDSSGSDPSTLGLLATFSTSASGTAVITNVGDQDLKVTGVSVTSDNTFFPDCSFSVSPLGGTKTIAPWGSIQVDVTFKNAGAGCYIEGALQVQSNDPYEPTSSLKLTGTALWL